MSDPISPDSILQTVAADRAKTAAYLNELQRESEKAELEREMLQKHVYENANPSPIFVVAVITAIIVCMYVVYVMFVKPCMSGLWMDVAGNEWVIKHNRFTSEFTVAINGECKGTGQTYDNYVKYGDVVGVWDYANLIATTEGWHLQRVVG